MFRRRHASTSSSSDSDHSSRKSTKKSKKTEVERLAEIERQRCVLTDIITNYAVEFLFLIGGLKIMSSEASRRRPMKGLRNLLPKESRRSSRGGGRRLRPRC